MGLSSAGACRLHVLLDTSSTMQRCYSILAWVSSGATLAPLPEKQALLFAGTVAPLTRGFARAEDTGHFIDFGRGIPR